MRQQKIHLHFSLSCGATLVEQLLALAVATLLIVTGISHYRGYHHHIDLARIKADVTAIFAAMNHYFDELGCQQDGTFNGRQKLDPVADLGLPATSDNYRAEIIAFKTNPKPMYHLVVLSNDRSWQKTLPQQNYRYQRNPLLKQLAVIKQEWQPRATNPDYFYCTQ